MNKKSTYEQLIKNLNSLLEGESDVISKMSTISCELFHTFGHWNWVGFYRLVDDKTLKVGPYHGTHGCLTIDIDQGVCGKCAREKRIQIENDVANLSHHIACSIDTRSEIVLPVFDKNNALKAVLDIDSIELDSFDEIDERYLIKIANKVFERN